MHYALGRFVYSDICKRESRLSQSLVSPSVPSGPYIDSEIGPPRYTVQKVPQSRSFNRELQAGDQNRFIYSMMNS